MAAPPHPDDTWRSLIHAGFCEDAPGPDCPHCKPEFNVVEAEEGESDDTVTSLGTSAAARSNDAPGTSKRRSEFPNTGRRRKEKTGKECKYFFCVQCDQGGLCVNEFLGEDSPHLGHPRLHIFRVNNEYCVSKEDMAGHLDTTSVMGTTWNNHTVHRLRTAKDSIFAWHVMSSVDASNSALSDFMHCLGCGKYVEKTTSMRIRQENERNWRVCSIQCLLLYREQQRLLMGVCWPTQPRRTRSPSH